MRLPRVLALNSIRSNHNRRIFLLCCYTLGSSCHMRHHLSMWYLLSVHSHPINQLLFGSTILWLPVRVSISHTIINYRWCSLITFFFLRFQRSSLPLLRLIWSSISTISNKTIILHFPTWCSHCSSLNCFILLLLIYSFLIKIYFVFIYYKFRQL